MNHFRTTNELLPHGVVPVYDFGPHAGASYVADRDGDGVRVLKCQVKSTCGRIYVPVIPLEVVDDARRADVETLFDDMKSVLAEREISVVRSLVETAGFFGRVLRVFYNDRITAAGNVVVVQRDVGFFYSTDWDPEGPDCPPSFLDVSFSDSANERLRNQSVVMDVMES